MKVLLVVLRVACAGRNDGQILRPLLRPPIVNLGLVRNEPLRQVEDREGVPLLAGDGGGLLERVQVIRELVPTGLDVL